jgi:hypothetical protein
MIKTFTTYLSALIHLLLIILQKAASTLPLPAEVREMAVSYCQQVQALFSGNTAQPLASRQRAFWHFRPGPVNPIAHIPLLFYPYPNFTLSLN